MNTGTPTPDSASHFSWRRCTSSARRAAQRRATRRRRRARRGVRYRRAATAARASGVRGRTRGADVARGAGKERCRRLRTHGGRGRRDDRRRGEPPASARQVAVREDEQQQRDGGDQPDRALGEQRDEPSRAISLYPSADRAPPRALRGLRCSRASHRRGRAGRRRPRPVVRVSLSVDRGRRRALLPGLRRPPNPRTTSSARSPPRSPTRSRTGSSRKRSKRLADGRTSSSRL